MEIVRFRGPKSKKWHGGTVLYKHGRVRTKEREAERKQKNGTRTPCHHAMVVPRVDFGFAMVEARVFLDVQFLLATRVRL